MTGQTPDHAEEELANQTDDAIPSRGYKLSPLVGLGGSAGSIPALKEFFQNTPADSGQAFVVVLHLAPEHVSTLAQVLQSSTTMPVKQVTERDAIKPNHVYVIPPRKAIRAVDKFLITTDDQLSPRGRHVAVDLFFRTLADTYGLHAAAIVLSGADGDGAIGIKRIKERGGLTVAQEPQEAEHPSMPRSAIATGMVDWVLPVAQMPARLKKYFAMEQQLKLPSEEEATPAGANGEGHEGPDSETALRDVLNFLRSRTGRDFSVYKRATVVRRIARRMQVNGVQDMAAYLDCLRTTPGEAGALLQDLLISVTNFFRDADCFAALDVHLAELFKGKGANETVRVWVPACATGEEAYTLAMMLADKSRELDAQPAIQVFATDLDEEAIRAAREGSYPATIEADVSEERLRRYFIKDHGGYKVRRELREMVLFAQHDLLKDSPFSRLDLISCRNLLIYLNRDAQRRVFEIFNFALVPHGHLFLGSSESAEDVSNLFAVVDKKNRIFVQRPMPRTGLPMAPGPSTLALALEASRKIDLHPVALPGRAFDLPPTANAAAEKLLHVPPPCVVGRAALQAPRIDRPAVDTGGRRA
jgi:two-component system, chemotaxis family, CheB/CheR fusion protein